MSLKNSSSFLALYFQQELKESSQNLGAFPIFVVPNCLDLSKYPCHKKSNLSELTVLSQTLRSHKCVNLGTLSRIHHKKSLDVAIQSLRLLKAQNVNVHLSIAGPDDGALNDLIHLSTTLDLIDHITFLPQLDFNQRFHISRP